MTVPDPGLTDLIAAHKTRLGGVLCECGWIGGPGEWAAHLAELLTAAYTITPKLVAKPGIPCGDWADGHSYRKCTRPRGHEGHHG